VKRGFSAGECVDAGLVDIDSDDFVTEFCH
jgi:hypothetical protein